MGALRKLCLLLLVALPVAAGLAGGASSGATRPSAGEPAWSPDGTQLAYSATGESGHLGDVYVASVDGSTRSDRHVFVP